MGLLHIYRWFCNKLDNLLSRNSLFALEVMQILKSKLNCLLLSNITFDFNLFFL